MSKCVLCGARYPAQTLRAFPSNKERRKIWFDACNLEYREGNLRLCLTHFSEENLELRREDGQQRLKPNAVPDIIFPRMNKDSERLEECEQNVPTEDSDPRFFADHVYELNFDKSDKIDTYELDLENGDMFGLRTPSRRFQKSPKNWTIKSNKRYNFRRRDSSPSSAKRKNVESSPENIGIGSSLNHVIENLDIGNPLVDIKIVNTVDNAIMVEEIHEIENIEIEDLVMDDKVNIVNNALMPEENYKIENIIVENPVQNTKISNNVGNAVMLRENILPDRWTVHKIPGNSVAYLKWGPEHEIEKKIIALPDFKTKIFFGNEQFQVQGFQSVSSKFEMSRLIRLIDIINRM